MLAALAVLSGSRPAVALDDRPPAYVVAAIRGNAMAWRELATSWQPVAVGDRIAAGTLLQLTSAGKVILTGVARPSSAPPQGVVVAADKPIIVRISPELPRRIEFGGYYAGLPIPSGEKAKKETLVYKLKEAWERTASIFSTADEKSIERPVNSQDIATLSQDKGAGEKAPAVQRLLEVAYPRNGDNFLVDRMPTRVAVRWTPPTEAHVARYIVTIQRIESNPRKLTATTDESYHTFPIDQPGRYRVVVESEDGAFKSTPNAFSITPLTAP
jgi:hypothetical protein